MLALAPLAVAKTVYIRDTLYVPLRTGQSEQYRIIHNGLISGTPLTLLQTNDDTGYTKVRMQDGTEGWIQTQYLQDDPVAKDQLAAVQKQLDALQTKQQDTLQQLQSVQGERDKLTGELKDTQAKLDSVENRYNRLREMSANVVKIDKRNTELEANATNLQQQVEELTDSNHRLKNNVAQSWFIRGGSLVFVAILLGFLVGRRLSDRRNTGWV